MATYVILNILFIAIVILALHIKTVKPSRSILFTLAILIVLTAVFDNVIIYLDIVDYDVTKILTVYVGLAPIEDFFYAILAVVLIPALWHKLGGTHAT